MGTVKRSIVLRLMTIVLALALATSGCSGSPANDDAGDHAQEGGDHAGGNHNLEESPDAMEGEFDHHGNRIGPELYEKVIVDGAVVEFTMENFLGVGGRGGETSSDLHAGERAVIKFRVTDEATGEAISGLQPAAWIDVIDASESQETLSDEFCTDQVEGYLGGTLTSRPTVDLNSFFILALNTDASISVIDPMVDVMGMTQLFALIQLPERGFDWVLTEAQDYLFVSMPDANAIAVAEMENFEVVHNISAGVNPTWLDIQPDGRYLWVTNNTERGTDSGVTVIDVETFEVAAQFATGKGNHRVAFSPDGHYAFITNSGSNVLSIIDTLALFETAQIDVGREAVAVAVSNLSNAVYVASAASGAITVIDLVSQNVSGEIPASPGITDMQFAPDGRWGFATSSDKDEVYVIDAATRSISHVVPVEGAPDQVTFAGDAVYIRSAEFPSMSVIQLADIAPQNRVSVASVPIGEIPPSEALDLPGGNAIHPGVTQSSLLIASPADDLVYYYTEGSQSTSGGFQGHGLHPSAILVVDRSLQEEVDGLYVGKTRIPSSGDFLVAFMMQEPFVLHCFEFSAKPNEALNEAGVLERSEITLFTDLSSIRAGERRNVQFSITSVTSGEPFTNIEDIQILIQKIGANWSDRITAVHLGDGIYETVIQVPSPGLYSLYFSAMSRQVTFDDLPSVGFKVPDS